MHYRENLIKPVLFMVFNRPEKTELVWDQIRKAKPRKLYVSADGPRTGRHDDDEKCKSVRIIVGKVDWDCDVKYLLHENNLGCSLAGKTAFDWVFDQEEEMIQLEDDTLPSQSFFWYSQEVLEKYKDDEKVGYITGQNFMGIKSGDASYFFSRYGGSSGWATWKRVYSKWDYKLSDFHEYAYSNAFKSNFDSKFEYKYWMNKFEDYINKGGNTYDLQSVYLVFKNNLVSIIPNQNLITNIGFDIEGSNFSHEGDKYSNIQKYDLDKIIHPAEIKRDKKTDQNFFRYHFMARSRLSYELRWLLGPVYRKLFRVKN